MTDLDHKLRSKGVGSSEIAMLIADKEGKPISPYGGPHKLARIKKGFQDAAEDTPATLRGKYFEPALLKFYADTTGREFRQVPTRRLEKHPVVVDSVDAIAGEPSVFDGDTYRSDQVRCVEAKTTHFVKRDEWGEPGTDQIPKHYILQCQWHCGAHMTPICDVPVDLGGTLEIYTVRFDQKLFEHMVEVAEKFWRDYIETDKMPPPDADMETSRWLARRLEQRHNDYIPASEELKRLLLSYREAKLTYDAMSEAVTRMENQIKVAIGEHAGIEIPDTGQRVSFKEQRGRISVNWKEIAMQLGADDQLIRKYTSHSASYRVFRPRGLLK